MMTLLQRQMAGLVTSNPPHGQWSLLHSLHWGYRPEHGRTAVRVKVRIDHSHKAQSRAEVEMLLPTGWTNLHTELAELVPNGRDITEDGLIAYEHNLLSRADELMESL